MCIWIAQNVRQSDALPPLPKRISKMWPAEQKPGTSCKYWIWVRGDFIYTGRFPAKLRLLHQAVTGSLYCIVLNYGAQLCYYKDAIGSNSQASQWNMGMHCYGQPSTRFQKCIQFSSLYTVVFLSIDKRKSPLSLMLSFQTVFADFRAAFKKNMCQLYVTQ